MAVAAAAVLFAAGCGGSVFYDNSRNWVIRNNEIPAYSSDYDVFYLYPTQVRHTSGTNLNWFQEGLTDTIRHYAGIMTADLAKYHVRIFSPFVPQLGFDSYSKVLEERNQAAEDFAYRKTGLEPAIRHAVLALRYYLKHYNPGGARPYVIIGQGQGAVILYEAMKEVSDVTPEKGLAAAYFQGLPGVTAETVRHDFHSRGIVPASGRYDYGVIVLFNTSLPGAASASVAPGSCVINPLNWRTDAQPAAAELNPGSTFCLRPGGRLRQIPRYCGATVDPEKGLVLLTGVPDRPKFQLGEQSFPSDAWGVFAASISRNAGERIREYLFRHQLKTAK